MLRAVIMGPPGSGKGTISSRIVRDFKILYLATGDCLRTQVLKGTATGILANEYIKKGELVPDDVVTKLILEHLGSFNKKNWLLDGFPRTLSQAESLSAKHEITSAINLNVPDAIIISRLKSRWLHPASGRIYNTQFNPPKEPGRDDITGEKLIQREDDMPSVVKARLEIYKKLNQPILDYYRKKKILIEFFGQETNEIWPRVKNYLTEFIEKRLVSEEFLNKTEYQQY